MSLQLAVSQMAGLCVSLTMPLFQRWHRSAMEFHVSMWLSSALLIILVVTSSECSAILSILDSLPSRISLSSNLVVGQWHIECDREWSSLSFCLKRWDVLSQSLGGSWPDPPWAVLSGTALPLPLSGSTTSYSHSTLLVLGDSYAPASDPPPMGGGFVVALQSATPLVLSSRACELTVALVRFAPDCASCYKFILIFLCVTAKIMFYWGHCLYVALDYIIDACESLSCGNLGACWQSHRELGRQRVKWHRKGIVFRGSVPLC